MTKPGDTDKFDQTGIRMDPKGPRNREAEHKDYAERATARGEHDDEDWGPNSSAYVGESGDGQESKEPDSLLDIVYKDR